MILNIVNFLIKKRTGTGIEAVTKRYQQPP